MGKAADHHLPPGVTGLTLHAAAAYDLAVWLMTLGRARALWEKILGLAGPRPGEAVLDVGCGTGSLALAAKRQVGPGGDVYGIDASPEMLARADRKAKKAGLDVVFRHAAAQSLPFPDAQFDIVLSTIMLHHLPRKAREQCALEIRRVLKPGGRVLAVDFAAPALPRKKASRFALSSPRRRRPTRHHGAAERRRPRDRRQRSGGIPEHAFCSCDGRGMNLVAGVSTEEPEPMIDHGRLFPRAWMIAVALIALLAAHTIGLGYLASHTTLSAAVLSGVAIVVVVKHVGLLGPIYALFRRRSRRDRR